MLLAGCSEAAVGPIETPGEQEPPTGLIVGRVAIQGLPSSAAPGDTLRAVVSVHATTGAPLDGEVVRVTASDGLVLRDSAVTDSLGRARIAWIPGRAPEQQLGARVDSVSAAATVRVVPVLARLEVSPADTAITSLADSVALTVRAWDRDGVEIPAPDSLALHVLTETRAVSRLAVLHPAAGLVLRFDGPGVATVAVRSGGVVSAPARVTASPAEAILDTVATSGPVVAGDEVTVRGYRLDLVDAAAVTVDGFPAAVALRDSATLRFAAPARTLAPCEGTARAPIVVAGARTPEPLSIRYARPGALTLGVGEGVRLGSAQNQCLTLPGEPDAEYALLYFDTRAVLASETAPEYEGQVFQLFDLEIADWSSGDPASAGPRAVTLSGSRLRDALPSPAIGRATAEADTVVCDFWAHNLDLRRTPFAVGDTVLLFFNGAYACGRVARIYGGRFPLIVLDRDSLRNIPGRLANVDAAMQTVVAHGVPAMDALSSNFAESRTGLGQLALVIATWEEGAPGFWSGEVIGLRDFGPVSEPVYMDWWIITHEMAHAWQDRHLEDVCAAQGLCGGGARGVWGGEGTADFLAEEAGRRMTGAAIDANVSPWEYSGPYSPPGGWSSNGTYLFGRGYGSSSWFLRDIAVRAMGEGVPHEEAMRAVARGASEGWYGQFVFGPARRGLVDRMSTLLGRAWDPVDALLTGALGLAMDDMTERPMFQYAPYRNAWETFTPMDTLGVARTRMVAGQYYGSSFGYVRILDGGRGGSYRFATSVPGVEWIVGRVR